MSRQRTVLALILFLGSIGLIVYIDDLPSQHHGPARAVRQQAPVPDVPGAATAALKRAPSPDAIQPETIVPEFGLPALPKLEELTASTDITVFLRKDVPEPLRNAALRRFWALDPEIRSYVGPLDYAYDWNVPGGVPGGGELSPGFDAARMVSEIMGGVTPGSSEIAGPATLAASNTGGPSASAPRTIRQRVVEATGMADFVTAIGRRQPPAGQTDTPHIASGKAASASSAAAGNLVALVLARPEINSLSDLNNRNIAIEEKQSASSGIVDAAFIAAGAVEIQFSESPQGAIDRLVRGEVSAAVLTLASPQAAEQFPDIAGFRTFKVPLAQKARL